MTAISVAFWWVMMELMESLGVILSVEFLLGLFASIFRVRLHLLRSVFKDHHTYRKYDDLNTSIYSQAPELFQYNW